MDRRLFTQVETLAIPVHESFEVSTNWTTTTTTSANGYTPQHLHDKALKILK